MDLTLNNLLYNTDDICDIFKSKGKVAALNMINKRYLKIIKFSNNNPHQSLIIFLNSLNKDLYKHIIFSSKENRERCFLKKNLVELKIDKNLSLKEEAEIILSSYEKFIPGEECKNIHIREACKYIDEHLDEDLSLEKVASKIYISRCHLCQLFASDFKMNFSTYINVKRVDLAKNLLINEDLSMENIAKKCGFSSCSYFSTTFKKIVGVTPRDYRKLNNKKF